MNVSQAEYITLDLHPYLRLIVNGNEALIGEFQESHLAMGYVPLSSRNPNVDWSKLLPEIKIPAIGGGRPYTLKGFTNDPVIVKMTRLFSEAINKEGFKTGPVNIPKL